MTTLSVHGETYAFHESEFPEYVEWVHSSFAGFESAPHPDGHSSALSPDLAHRIKLRAQEALGHVED